MASQNRGIGMIGTLLVNTLSIFAVSYILTGIHAAYLRPVPAGGKCVGALCGRDVDRRFQH